MSKGFAHAIQEQLNTVSRTGVPSATATTEEDFTKQFLRADLLGPRIVHGVDVVLEILAGTMPKRASTKTNAIEGENHARKTTSQIRLSSAWQS